ncbi:MAG TPA: DJ-1 family glyoxalase III [Nitrospiria bacterium]|nr:DJ-1 family glyoxalase III [Nitrospiria bacterium]
MARRVVVPIAQGVEEIEAVTVIDILRRAGIDVTVAGVTADPVTGRSKIRLLADRPIDQVKSADVDMVILPGGAEGTGHLQRSVAVKRLIKEIAALGKPVAAICAAPTVLAGLGLLNGKRVTSHPSVEHNLGPVNYAEDRVIVDGGIITSRGPGTAMEFAMALVEILAGKEKVAEVNRGVLANI